MSQQISPQLFATLTLIPTPIIGDHKERVQRLQNFLKLKDAILELGDLEHSGDWDPYINITLNDGTRIETQNGSHEIQIQNEVILLEDELGYAQHSDGDISYHVIQLKDIATIQLER